MAKHGKSLRAFLFADPAGILLKRDIEHSMQRVLDTPVLPYRMGEPHCVGWERGQKIAGVDLDGVSYFTTGFYHPDALQISPGSLGSTPFNVRRDPIPTRFNAAVIPIDGFMVGVLDISKAGVPGISEKQRHCLRERRVIVLEGQDVICFLLRNGLGNLFLTSHRVNRHHRPWRSNRRRSSGMAVISLDFSATFSCPKTKRLALAQALTIWMAAVAVA